MIFLDTNMFLRHLTAPVDATTEIMRRTATAIFEAVERGEEEIITTEVVLHEVFYVLGSKAHYGLPPATIVEFLLPILSLAGFKFPAGDKRIYQRALDIFESSPKLEFSDSVIAARAEHLDIPLATFDEALGQLPFITRWVPPE